MSAGIDIIAVTKTYDGSTLAVDAVDMSIREGEFFSLLGPSGCGKTTTLRMIAGFETPTKGTIAVGGADVTHVPAHKRDMGMVFQNYALFPHRSVGENVAFGLRMRGMDRTTIARKVADALTQVELVGYEDRVPDNSPEASSSASRWPAPSSSNRACCCATNRSARSTRSCGRRCSSS
jgi:putative spermidine/putrescine transport system ATP-binding protein